MKHLLPFLLTATVLAAQQPARLLGTVTANDGKAIQVTTDQGQKTTVLPTPQARVQKVAPGERDLSKAQTITLADLRNGDRVIVRGAAADGGILADSLIVMTAREISQKNDAERQMWRDRGVFGVVESVDARDRQVKLRTRVGMETKTFTVDVGEKAEVKRYAPDSVKFSDAVAAKIEEIKKGDQLRALGEKNEEAAKLTAARVVFGTFRTFAGTVLSVDAAARSLQLKEVDGKKTLTVHATADSTLKTVPAQMGIMLARRPAMGGRAGGGMEGGGMERGMPRPAGETHGVPAGARTGGGGGFPPGGGPPDIGNMLERMPAVEFSALKAGDTVIVASTLGAKQDTFTAITLLAGAQPVLDMLAASHQAAQARQGPGLSIGGASGMSGGAGGEGGLGGLGIGMMP